MKEKNLKLITKILAILIICLVSFLGLYVQKGNVMKNIVKEFEYSKDLKGYREFIFEVSNAQQVTNSEGQVVGDTDKYSDTQIESNSYIKTESKVNPDETLNYENYVESKRIIEERLKGLNVQDYNISLDGENGRIYLAIPEDSETDHVASNLLQVGKFEMRDSKDSSNIFVSNNSLKKASAVYNTGTSGTVVYIQFEFDKTGKNTLKDISNGEYKTENSTKDETEETEETEENESEEGEFENEEDSQKKIVLAIDDNELITSSFDDPIDNGFIDLSMNQATTDEETINKTLKSASTIALVLNSGKMPLKYKISENNYIGTDISKNSIKKVICAVSIITVILLVFLIIENKKRGVLASICFIGFVALNLLVIRYTNVMISIESIVAEIVVIIINYSIVRKLLLIKEDDVELNNKLFLEELKQCVIKLLPIFIGSVVLTFVKWTAISSFGMVLFWGLLLGCIYNFIITKNMLEN